MPLRNGRLDEVASQALDTVQRGAPGGWGRLEVQGVAHGVIPILRTPTLTTSSTCPHPPDHVIDGTLR